ncbi:helix-turn-helix domain-containing protein [Paenibacillus sp. y28]|uniref:helix-turn-helix domain-containing protein n=1 Tax=Paenibacillus sp. y28 TaxID=3129110 RepID=UPI00301AED21
MRTYKITIRAARINAGLTGTQAADLLGISARTLSKYERNSGKMTLGVIVKMLAVYAVPYDLLYFGPESECVKRNNELSPLEHNRDRMPGSRLKPAGPACVKSARVAPV